MLNGDITSLINDINDAQVNHAGEANIIRLAAGGTYALTAVDNTTNGANGLPAITITGTGSLTIEGNGATLTRNAAAEFRFFVVNGGNLTLNDLTLTNGIGTAEGGALRLQSGSLTLNDVTVSGNSTDGTGKFGGAGIFVAAGTATITDSLITGNTAASTSFLGGGGLYVNGGTVTITGTTISQNSAKATGGAITIAAGSVTITASRITDNDATNDGGGIFKFNASLTIIDSVISGNRGNQGGGLGINSGLVTIRGSTIADNEAFAANGGGGLFLQNGATLALTDSTVAGNHATNGTAGGGIRLNGSAGAAITRSTISGNTAATQGGGVYLATNGSVTITNATISGNTATAEGGGLYAALSSSGTLTIANSTIANNRADVDNAGGELGGGIKMFNMTATPTVTLTSTIVAGNFVGSGATANDLDRTPGTGPSTLNVTFSLIQTGAAAINGTNTNNIFGQDARLAPLADNGGPTWTHALLAGSPAIDTGANPLGLATDQRGFARQLGTAPDIGAHEGNLSPSAPSANAVVVSILQGQSGTPPAPPAPASPPETTPAAPVAAPLASGPERVITSGGTGGSDAPAPEVGEVVAVAPEVVQPPKEAPPADPKALAKLPANSAPVAPANPPAGAPRPAAVVQLPQPAIHAPPFAAVFLREQLDTMMNPDGPAAVGSPGQLVVLPVLAAASALTVGYVMFYTRAAFLLLGAIGAGSTWRELDPVAFLDYWEREGRQAKASAREQNEQRAESMFD